MEKSRPHVILSAAMTIDGKIASFKGDSELSSHKDKVRIHKLRTKVDAILVGSKTVKKDNPSLTVRYAKGKNPIRIILDSKCSISLNSKIVLTSKKIPTIVATSKLAPKKNIENLKKHSIQVIVTGQNQINLKNLLQKLYQNKIKTILVEGGGKVNWDFIKHGFIDEIIITVTPHIVGGSKAITLVEGKGFSEIKKSQKFKLKKIQRIKSEIVLHYIT